MPENVVQHHHDHLLMWLEERQKRSEVGHTQQNFGQEKERNETERHRSFMAGTAET